MADSPPSTQSNPSRRKAHEKRNLLVASVLIVLLLVIAIASLGNPGNKSSSSATTINSPAKPVSGEELFNAYALNQTQADATYTQKVVYIQDTIDPGEPAVVSDPNAGQYYSTIYLGRIVMYWSDQSQALQITPGQEFLARCTVGGMELSQEGFDLLYLINCVFANPS